MEITQVRVFPVQEDKLKAFISIVLSTIVSSSATSRSSRARTGLFVSMPSKKRKDGTFRDIAHPLNNETRRKFEEQIIAKYREVVEESGGDRGPACAEGPRTRSRRGSEPCLEPRTIPGSGASPSGKAPAFGAGIRRFESSRPSHSTQVAARKPEHEERAQSLLGQRQSATGASDLRVPARSARPLER